MVKLVRHSTAQTNFQISRRSHLINRVIKLPLGFCFGFRFDALEALTFGAAPAPRPFLYRLSATSGLVGLWLPAMYLFSLKAFLFCAAYSAFVCLFRAFHLIISCRI
ncbi:MAG: hypothetical protein P8P89_01880 [Paracoccaceae bacterium]|nr:hypothetical protein [Paracoccaceae bacterium]